MLQSDWNWVKDLEKTYIWNWYFAKTIMFLYHSSNGVVEKKNRQIMKVDLTMIVRCNVPMIYWDYAFKSDLWFVSYQ